MHWLFTKKAVMSAGETAAAMALSTLAGGGLGGLGGYLTGKKDKDILGLAAVGGLTGLGASGTLALLHQLNAQKDTSMDLSGVWDGTGRT